MELEKKKSSKRLYFVDELRGFWIVNMVIYHGIWDLIYIFGVNWNWFSSDIVRFYQQVGCSSFICISGFCWQMSRKPLKRGLQVFLAGAVITVATLLVMPDSLVLFGVLTMLGSSMLLMIPLDKLFKKINPWVGYIAAFVMFMVVYSVNDGFIGFGSLKLVALPREWYSNLFASYLGFTESSFYSTDYFSLLPWFFMFLQGYFLHSALYKNMEHPVAQKAEVFLEKSFCPFFGWVGRNSLIIYMLHQPVVYGLLWLLMQ